MGKLLKRVFFGSNVYADEASARTQTDCQNSMWCAARSRSSTPRRVNDTGSGVNPHPNHKPEHHPAS
jgi:hypothetical protein